MDPDRNFDWNFYDCNVYLRELGSDSESHIHLGNRGEWSLRSVWEGREYCQQEIIDWLGLNMKPYEFSNLFPLYFGYQKAPSNSAKLREVSMWENSREWLGGLSELENQLNLARNAFLNDEISWAEQIEFLTNGIKIKTTLLNRIKVSTKVVLIRLACLNSTCLIRKFHFRPNKRGKNLFLCLKTPTCKVYYHIWTIGS